MTDAEFVEAFERRALGPECFRHRDHVRLAWCYLRELELPEALIRMRDGIRRFADSIGRPGLYHETITFAFVAIIHERLRAGGAEKDWEDFARENPDLFQWKPSVLERYYMPETLSSDRARRFFAWPDRS